jgi:hypothetical protein
MPRNAEVAARFDAVEAMREIGSPATLVAVLRAAADAYDESVGELEAAWQDPTAGKVWAVAARSLRQSATLIERYWESI